MGRNVAPATTKPGKRQLLADYPARAARAGVKCSGLVHPFSLHLEHPDADCVPAAAGSILVLLYQKDVPYLCALPALQDLVYS